MAHQDFRTVALARYLRAQGVVACPAEAVWGLSCDPFSEEAVTQLLAMKYRPVTKGLIVVAADEWMLAPLIEGLSIAQQKELALGWPGPNTWLVPNRGMFPPWITGGGPEVAVRITSAPALRALSRCLAGPLVSTSANPAGASPATSSFQVVRYFGAALPRAPGSIGAAGKPSTIRRLGTGAVIRH